VESGMLSGQRARAVLGAGQGSAISRSATFGLGGRGHRVKTSPIETAIHFMYEPHSKRILPWAPGAVSTSRVGTRAVRSRSQRVWPARLQKLLRRGAASELARLALDPSCSSGR